MCTRGKTIINIPPTIDIFQPNTLRFISSPKKNKLSHELNNVIVSMALEQSGYRLVLRSQVGSDMQD